MAAIAVFVVLGLWAGLGSGQELPTVIRGGEGPSLLSGFGVALIAVLWSYDGFSNLNFSASEIKEPGPGLCHERSFSGQLS